MLHWISFDGIQPDFPWLHPDNMIQGMNQILVYMGDEQVSSQILDALVQVVHKASYVESRPVDLGHGELLSAAEIHLIDMAGRFPSDNISELATRLGVTKGAVSQMVQKLEVRGFLVRKKDADNRKNISLHLTPSGRKAFAWHMALHRELDQQILSFLTGLEECDQDRLLSALSGLSRTIDQSLELREEHLRHFLEMYPP